MLTTINALLPVFLVIAIGFTLYRTKLVGEEMWSAFEHLCYYVLFPVLLVKTLATADFTGLALGRYVAALLFAIVTMSALILIFVRPLVRRVLRTGDPAFTSLFQGVTRWHGFIALSIAGSLYGEQGVTFTAIVIGTIVPALNAINVTVLASILGKGYGFKRVALQILRNPFILACGLGIGLNFTGIGLPSPILETATIIGSGALGLSLLVVGAGIRFDREARSGPLVVLGATLRLIGMPALMFLGTWLLGIDGTARTVAVIAGAVPTAASAYVLARQMGGDAPLMANMISFQVIAAAFTLPVAVMIAEAL